MTYDFLWEGTGIWELTTGIYSPPATVPDYIAQCSDMYKHNRQSHSNILDIFSLIICKEKQKKDS